MYLYKKCEDGANGKRIWKCVECVSANSKEDVTDVTSLRNYNHSPKPVGIEKKIIVLEVKGGATIYSETPIQILREVIKTYIYFF